MTWPKLLDAICAPRPKQLIFHNFPVRLSELLEGFRASLPGNDDSSQFPVRLSEMHDGFRASLPENDDDHFGMDVKPGHPRLAQLKFSPSGQNA